MHGGREIPGVQLGACRAPVYRAKERDDLLVVAFPEGSVGAAVTTTNRFCAAPVTLLKAHLEATAAVRFWLLNAGNANAGTGRLGLLAAHDTVSALADVTGAAPESIWPFSTGVIGEPLPVASIVTALPRALAELSSSVAAWERASRAIMTTDTRPKLRHITCELDGVEVTLTGMTKGSGMIHPNMATMFGLIVTDAKINANCLDRALRHAVNHMVDLIWDKFGSRGLPDGWNNTIRRPSEPRWHCQRL